MDAHWYSCTVEHSATKRSELISMSARVDLTYTMLREVTLKKLHSKDSFYIVVWTRHALGTVNSSPVSGG